MKNKVVKIIIEGIDSGKYILYTTNSRLLDLLNSDLFTESIVDAKSGEEFIHKNKVLYALQLENKIQ